MILKNQGTFPGFPEFPGFFPWFFDISADLVANDIIADIIGKKKPGNSGKFPGNRDNFQGTHPGFFPQNGRFPNFLYQKMPNSWHFLQRYYRKKAFLGNEMFFYTKKAHIYKKI